MGGTQLDRTREVFSGYGSDGPPLAVIDPTDQRGISSHASANRRARRASVHTIRRRTSSLSFFSRRFSLTDFDGFLDVALRGDLSAMSAPFR